MYTEKVGVKVYTYTHNLKKKRKTHTYTQCTAHGPHSCIYARNQSPGSKVSTRDDWRLFDEYNSRDLYHFARLFFFRFAFTFCSYSSYELYIHTYRFSLVSFLALGRLASQTHCWFYSILKLYACPRIVDCCIHIHYVYIIRSKKKTVYFFYTNIIYIHAWILIPMVDFEATGI